jgi:ABC-type lipoprotein release transport system permease subunit
VALRKLWTIGYRDLWRNRRRTLLTMTAIALGLALLIMINGFIAGVMEDSLQNAIRLQTGHVQVRAAGYPEGKLSLQWKDLLDEPTALAAQAAAMPEVQAAAPVLWMSSVLNTREDSVGLQIYGIDTTSAIYAPIRNALVEGTFLTPEDRDGILLGKRLADSLGLRLGDRVNLTVIDANGQPAQALYTIRGLFSSGVVAYDESAVFLPLDKAQAFAGTGNRASTIMILLNRQGDADAVAAALRTPERNALTWEELNQLYLVAIETALSFYVFLDAIVMLIGAVIVANTLLMAVFERTREIGILAALGMKRRQIMGMMLLEALILALAGVIVGVALGLGLVAYLSVNGIPLGDMGSAASNIALGSEMRARFVPVTFAWLAFWTLTIAVVASLYPAWFAARLEPVQALHAS